MAKQITRWFGRESRYQFSVWSKKPAKYDKEERKFVGKYGYLDDYSSFFVARLLNAKHIVPALKKMKIGQVKKVTIIVE